VLVLIPGNVHDFHNLYGRWLGEAVQAAGATVTVCTVDAVPPGGYELCLIANISEVLDHAGSAGRSRLSRVCLQCESTVALTWDCVRTNEYRRGLEHCRALGIRRVLDLGYAEQGEPVQKQGFRYDFVFDGLLESQTQLQHVANPGPERTIPWAFVGLNQPRWVALAHQLVKEFDPGGFIYLPEVSALKKPGAPHLGPRQLLKVLERTQFYVWCSHHEHFSMELLRFKSAWMAGCVPIKVVGNRDQLPAHLPFADLVVRESHVAEMLNCLDFQESWQTFAAEYLRLPRLEDEIVRWLNTCGFVQPSTVHVNGPASSLKRVA